MGRDRARPSANSLAQLSRRLRDFLPRLSTPVQMLGQKLFYPAIEIYVVFRSDEPVAGVGRWTLSVWFRQKPSIAAVAAKEPQALSRVLILLLAN